MRTDPAEHSRRGVLRRRRVALGGLLLIILGVVVWFDAAGGAGKRAIHASGFPMSTRFQPSSPGFYRGIYRPRYLGRLCFQAEERISSC